MFLLIRKGNSKDLWKFDFNITLFEIVKDFQNVFTYSVNSSGFLSKKGLDNPPFQPAMSFQRSRIIWAVQFSPKKSSPSELCRMVRM